MRTSHKPRFSKKTMLDELDLRIAIIQDRWHFDRSNGSAQLDYPKYVGSPQARIDYAEMTLLESLIDFINWR